MSKLVGQFGHFINISKLPSHETTDLQMSLSLCSQAQG